VVAQARNGREAVDRFEALRPDVCFLDVHMPGLSGIEAAGFIGTRAHVVFVTAHDQYAVQAFEHGAIDYLVKPVESARLAATVARLKDRLSVGQPGQIDEKLLELLAARLQRKVGTGSLRWIRASVGQALCLIAADEIDFLRSEEKYTTIGWRDNTRKPREAIIRAPLKELLAQLDPSQFVQIHRSVVVNLRAISHVVRGENETAIVHLKGRDNLLPVSRIYTYHFRQM
jgi:DNA-binding LytR/AlgR family response regulator